MRAERVICVVDDDDAVRGSICMLLDSYGITARPYASGAALLADLPPEHGCLLVDVDLPGINGLELLGQLRGRGITIPAIVMTGALTSRIRLAAERAGAILLSKPFRSGELIACVEQVLGRL
jgi:two-component system, LuxR family, response regulator FixJ